MPIDFERYDRQIRMPEIGEEGQKKLAAARVLVVGLGGLGSPVLYNLAAAGVGHIRGVDVDTVSLSNLNRQILHTPADIGRTKAASAHDKIAAFAPEVDFEALCLGLDADNVDELVRDCDVIVSCVDNLPTRYLLAQSCLRLKKPVVEAGISGFGGFVMTVLPGEACIGCMYGRLREPEGAPAVFGACAGVAGSLQAAEVIKLLVGAGEPLRGQVLYFDLLYPDFSPVIIRRAPDCPVCGGIE